MKTNKKYFILLILFTISTCLYAQESQIGKKVADLTFKKVLNDKDTTYKLADFAGKVILLDFWATHCKPCIQAFPELENLQKEFSADLKIITITNDNETRIARFLEKFKTKLPIAIDNNEDLSNVFPHRSIPHTILIDKKGIIKVIATSSEITKDVIQKIINGESVNVEEKKENMEFEPQKYSLSGTPNVFGQITLTQMRKGLPSVSTKFRNGRMILINLLPSTIYEALYSFPYVTRSFWETDKKKYEWEDANLYCLEIVAPNKTEQEAKQLLINYLQTNISLKVRLEKKEMKVKILSRKDKNLNLIVANETETSESSSGGYGLKMQNSSINVLANYLEGTMMLPVIDETGLNKKYNLTINWYNENPNKIHEELKKWV